jgi:alpha-beta hydrolase superfamily lysophospholipase
MRHDEGHYAAQPGIDIFYQSWTPDGKPVAMLLIVHGLGDHSSRYQNYVDYFAPKGYAIYAPDLRGHGRSDGRRGHVNRFDEYVNDLRQLHNRARGADPDSKVFLLGHSLGSLVVLTYALRYPEGLAGVISSGTALRDTLAVPGWLRSAAGGLSKIAPTLAANNGVKTGYISHDSQVREAYDRDPLVHRVGTLRLSAEVDIARSNLMEHASQWKLPLLMLHGRDDPICLLSGAREFYDKTDHAWVEFRQYTGMYHEVHNEVGKEAVFKDIESWLQARR